MAQAGIEPSVSGKGDDAPAYTIIGLYMAELMHRRAPWKRKQSLTLAILEGALVQPPLAVGA